MPEVRRPKLKCERETGARLRDQALRLLRVFGLICQCEMECQCGQRRHHMTHERAELPMPSEDSREYARRIVRAHQHGHGSKDPEKCPYCRDLIDVITLALTAATAALREEVSDLTENLGKAWDDCVIICGGRESALREENERLRWECDSVAFEMEGWKQKNRKDNEYLLAELDRLRAALEEVNAELMQWRERQIGSEEHEVMFLDYANLDGDDRQEVVVAAKPRRVLVFRAGGDGSLIPAIDSQTRWPRPAGGFDRRLRAVWIEAGLLFAAVSPNEWSDCKESPARCLEAMEPLRTMVNTSPEPHLCGRVGLVRQRVLPWAWARARSRLDMPSKLLLLEVECGA